MNRANCNLKFDITNSKTVNAVCVSVSLFFVRLLFISNKRQRSLFNFNAVQKNEMRLLPGGSSLYRCQFERFESRNCQRELRHNQPTRCCCRCSWCCSSCCRCCCMPHVSFRTFSSFSLFNFALADHLAESLSSHWSLQQKTFIAAILHTKCMQQAKCIYLRTTFDFDAAQQATRMPG